MAGDDDRDRLSVEELRVGGLSPRTVRIVVVFMALVALLVVVSLVSGRHSTSARPATTPTLGLSTVSPNSHPSANDALIPACPAAARSKTRRTACTSPLS